MGGRLLAGQGLGQVGAREGVLAEYCALATHKGEVRHFLKLRTVEKGERTMLRCSSGKKEESERDGDQAAVVF